MIETTLRASVEIDSIRTWEMPTLFSTSPNAFSACRRVSGGDGDGGVNGHKGIESHPPPAPRRGSDRPGGVVSTAGIIDRHTWGDQPSHPSQHTIPLPLR